MEKKQPGVMLYFDRCSALKRVSYEDKGRLLEAILEYGEHGVVPDFDGVLGLAWDFIRPGLDKDRERYERRVESAKRAANTRWEQERADDSLVF
jgi:hypothetical protein